MNDLNIPLNTLLDEETVLQGFSAEVSENTIIRSLCVDSRKIQKGDWFICLKGETFDGHDFIEVALAAGAAGIIYDRANINCKGIRVSDTLIFLGKIANQWRKIVNPVVIAITGSNGKTSVKELISFLIEKYARNQVCQSAGNFNNQYGVPYTLLSLRPSHRFLVIEVGTNHPGEIAPLSVLSQPDYAIITSISPGHIGNFGSLESIALEKSEIIAGLKPSGILFIHQDLLKFAEIQKKAAQHGCIVKTPDHLITLIKNDESGIDFLLDGETFHYPVYGLHQFQNLLLAHAILSEIIKDSEKIKEALRELKNYNPVKGRLQKTRNASFNIWDDTYNANPASYKEAIQFIHKISQASSASHTFGAFGMMGELGDFSEKAHEELGRLTVEQGFSAVFFSADNEKIRNAFLKGRREYIQEPKLPDIPDTMVASNSDQDIAYGYKYLRSKMNAGDHLLVKGSRSTRMERMLKYFT